MPLQLTLSHIQIVELSKLADQELRRLASKWSGESFQKSNAPLLPTQRLHLGGRAALTLLSGNSDAENHSKLHIDEEFGFNQLIRGNEKYFVSFSHTASISVAVISDKPIGIDVEVISRDTRRVHAKLCTPLELNWVKQNSTIEGRRVENGLLLWTGKEAASKCTGLGMQFGLKNFEIDLGQKPPFSVSISKSGPIQVLRPFVDYRIYKNYLLAICTEEDEIAQFRGLHLLTYPHS